MNMDNSKKLVGILGYPLSHSLSPVMQNMAFKYYNLNNVYVPIEVKPEDLEIIVKAIRGMNFIGFNVTVPHKIEVVKYLDEMDKLAELIGAVNTVVVKDGNLKGYNTDGIGFLKSFQENTNESIEGKRVFILGAGGASRAVSMTLAMNKAEKVYICNRTYEKAERLSQDINTKIGNVSAAVPMEYEKMKEVIYDSDVFINTTTVGMHPNVDESPIDRSLLHENLILCDIVYNPRKTKLLEEAEELGCKTVPGLSMLVYQGAESFRLWTGMEAPVDIMFKAVENIS